MHPDRSLSSRTWVLVAAVLLVASAFVGARWAVAAERDISCFALIGSAYAQDATACVQEGTGYDGQFAYRVAVDPYELTGRSAGVVLDSPLRLQRVTYPWLAHALALGQDDAVPVTLVLVNLLAAAALAAAGIAIARGSGRAPWAGLLPVGFFGLLTTLGRDLTELVTAAALVGGVVAWRADRRWLAALAFAAAALSRESACLLVLAFAAGELIQTRAWRRVLPLAALPTAAFVGWQAIAWAGTGEVPLLASQGKNLVPPFTDLLPAAVRWADQASALERQGLIDLGQLLALTALVVVAARAAWQRRGQLDGLTVAWAVSMLLVVSLSANVWKGPADFRTAAELWVLSCLLLLRSRLDLRLIGVLTGTAWLATAAFRVTSL